MQGSENLEIIRRLFAFYHKGDMKAMMSFFTSDAIWIEPGDYSIPYAGVFEGITEIQRMLGIIAQHLRMISFQADSFCANENIVTAIGSNEAEVIATGKIYKTDWVYVFTLVNAHITNVQVYMDTQAISVAFR